MKYNPHHTRTTMGFVSGGGGGERCREQEGRVGEMSTLSVTHHDKNHTTPFTYPQKFEIKVSMSVYDLKQSRNESYFITKKFKKKFFPPYIFNLYGIPMKMEANELLHWRPPGGKISISNQGQLQLKIESEYYHDTTTSFTISHISINTLIILNVPNPQMKYLRLVFSTSKTMVVLLVKFKHFNLCLFKFLQGCVCYTKLIIPAIQS